MNPLTLQADPTPATTTAAWQALGDKETLPVNKLRKLISDIRRSREFLDNVPELSNEPVTLEFVIGSDPRD